VTQIALIAPCESLASIASETARKTNMALKIKPALLGDAINVAKQLQSEGAQVLVSRGGTALVLQNAPELSLPVIEIRVTAYDVVRAIAEARKFGPRIGVIGFENMVLGASTLETVLGVEIQEFLLRSPDETEANIQSAIKHGVDAVIGGVITVRTAGKLKIKAVLIESGPEAIRHALDEAMRVLQVKKQENAKAQRIKLILDSVSDGIVSFDGSERITVFNKAMENLTGVGKKDAIGQRVTSVIPGIHSTRRFTNIDGSEYPEILKINEALVSVTSLPIRVDGDSTGTVVTFQEVHRLENLEKDLRRRLYSNGHIARFDFNDIIGESECMQRTIARARRFAEVDSKVLILGETGTGKELFAQSIHNNSPRRYGPFVAVNCAVLPENLLESELFGYVEGAFTGARKGGKPGLFELAHGGTIFLDEIGALPSRLHGRLLRVLQEKEVMRLGDDKIIPVDARIISASNKDLKKLVHQGDFQEDLYYRLDVLKLFLPPLRERLEDIPLLVKAFSDAISRDTGILFEGFTDDALSLLSAYDWPGNVRQLRNVVEKCIALYQKGPVTAQDMLTVLSDDLYHVPDDSQIMNEPLDDIVRKTTKKAILKALELAGGNKGEAARVLGISRSTLWRKLQGE